MGHRCCLIIKNINSCCVYSKAIYALLVRISSKAADLLATRTQASLTRCVHNLKSTLATEVHLERNRRLARATFTGPICARLATRPDDLLHERLLAFVHVGHDAPERILVG